MNWSGKHASSNDLFAMDCTPGKIILKNILNKPTGTGSSKQFFLFIFEITYDTPLVDKREKLVKECKRALLEKSIFSSGVDDWIMWFFELNVEWIEVIFPSKNFENCSGKLKTILVFR